jgi:ribosomal protein S18 acetylase RimI-like enzyme
MNQDMSEPSIIPLSHELATDVYLCFLEAFPGQPLSLTRFREVYFTNLSFDTRFSFVWKEQDQVIGFLLAKPLSDSSIYILLCGVRQGYQRRGGLGMLLRNLEQNAKQCSYTSFYLDIVDTNTPAIRAFERWGYQHIATASSFYFDKPLFDNDLSLVECPRPSESGVNAFDSAFLDGVTFFTVYSGQRIGTAAVDITRKQIVHISIEPEYRGRGRARQLISKIVADTGCRYVFRVQEPQWKTFLMKVGFEIILEQIVFRKS